MSSTKTVLPAKGGFLSETRRTSGLSGCFRKILSAIKMKLPLFVIGRRTNSSVGAYFDLITDDARMFYGDDFHFGYYKSGDESFEDALGNHTDIVSEMAGLGSAKRALDIGCGICAPAIRIAKNTDCHITGVNISAEQVRQGRNLVEKHGLSHRIAVQEGNALKLDFDDSSFDAILCIEVAGDICVTHKQKESLIREMYRVLKPGGRIGFSDLVFKGVPTREEEETMRSILYHDGAVLITDWPGIFRQCGFTIAQQLDIIDETMKTWDHSLTIYESKASEVERRYGKRIAERTTDHLHRLPKILEKYGSFVVFSAQKP